MKETKEMIEERTVTLSVYRYDPSKDSQPYMKEYAIRIPQNKDIMVLSLLEKLKNESDSSVSYRRSCREGVCGSDAMNINGKNGLACMTSLMSLGTDNVILRPLPGFPVIRDLVVDMTQFYQQYEKVQPYLQNDNEPPAKEHLQSPKEREQLDGLYECILCACCSSSCPSYWWNPDKFIGPAGLLQATRFLMDSRDTHKKERLEKLEDAFSVYRCRSIMNCGYVCPKGLNPTAAIAKIRDMQMENNA